MRRGIGILLAVAALGLPACAQRRPMDVPDPLMQPERGRTRLILKDGTYQVVLRYEIVGAVVRYVSAVSYTHLTGRSSRRDRPSDPGW